MRVICGSTRWYGRWRRGVGGWGWGVGSCLVGEAALFVLGELGLSRVLEQAEHRRAESRRMCVCVQYTYTYILSLSTQYSVQYTVCVCVSYDDNSLSSLGLVLISLNLPLV